ncbi:hypothetical protein BH09VER1_BH09VER1_46860 [soil metagenome]
MFRICTPLCLGAALLVSFPRWAEAVPKDPEELFQTTHVWPLQLTFTPEQWTAIEPDGGKNNPGPSHGPGPAQFIAPVFLSHGDQNQDGQLSAEEFRALGGRWFDEWDKKQSGRLDPEQLRAGLKTVFVPPSPGQEEKKSAPRGPGMVAAEGKRNGMAGAIGVDFPYVHADLNFDGEAISDVAARYKGNNTYIMSRNALKRPLKLDLNKYVKGQKLAAISTINLHNNVNDPGVMNEVLSYRLFRDAGVPASRTSYARVSLTVPGTYDKQYIGLYTIVENIDKKFINVRFGTRKGVVLKPTTRDLFADLGDDWAKYNQIYDPKDDISQEDAQRVIAFSQLVTNADDATFAAQLGDFLDLDEFARYMAVLVWLPSMDSLLEMGQNFYIYLNPSTNKFIFLPWDYDHSFGQWPMGGGNLEKLSIEKPWRGQNRFLERVFKVDAFKRLYLAHMTEFTKTIFQPRRIIDQVDEIAAVVRPAIREESAEELAAFDRAMAGKVDRPESQAKTVGARPGPPAGSFTPIKAFVPLRAQSVVDQLAGKTDDPKGILQSTSHRGFGPESFLADFFMSKLDADKSGDLTRAEFVDSLGRWFTAWDADKNNFLSEEELRAGVTKDFAPPRPGGPPAPQNLPAAKP